jgi:hypothetical protein
VAVARYPAVGPAHPARVHRVRRDSRVASVVGGPWRGVPVRGGPGDDGDVGRHRGGPVPRSRGGAPARDRPHAGDRRLRVGRAVAAVSGEHGSGADAGGQCRPWHRIRGADGPGGELDRRPGATGSSRRGRRSVRLGDRCAQPAGGARGRGPCAERRLLARRRAGDVSGAGRPVGAGHRRRPPATRRAREGGPSSRSSGRGASLRRPADDHLGRRGSDDVCPSSVRAAFWRPSYWCCSG